MNKKIIGRIVGYSIKKEGEQPVIPANHDPIYDRIEKRPDGCLDAQACKAVYFTQEGRRSLYLVVSYMAMKGRLNGEEVEVERPVEFFIPAAQKTEDMQWISALMRQSSKMALKDGDLGNMFNGLRDVTWDKGPVRCGVNEWDKPLYHNSEVAAIAYSFIDILHKRGICDRDGNLLSLEARVANYRLRNNSGCGCAPSAPSEPEETPFIARQSVGAAAVAMPEIEAKGSGPECPVCHETIRFSEGCQICGCGSKCG